MGEGLEPIKETKITEEQLNKLIKILEKTLEEKIKKDLEKEESIKHLLLKDELKEDLATRYDVEILKLELKKLEEKLAKDTQLLEEKIEFKTELIKQEIKRWLITAFLLLAVLIALTNPGIANFVSSLFGGQK